MTDEILSRLLAQETVSGQAMSEALGVTRAAVWKQIEQLRAQGFEIESVGRLGYRLIACPDSLAAPVVAHGLHTRWAGREIITLDSVDSTNRHARRLAAQGAKAGTLVLAEEQTAGRGRRGRGWISPAGDGVFMSLILRPEGHPSQVARLSLLAALAAARAVSRASGLDARIKWPNDIVCQGRKVCGILLEMSADEQSVHDVVVGVGVNVHQQVFDEEIRRSAGSLDLLSGRRIVRADVVRAFLEEMESLLDLLARDDRALMAAYRERSATIGQTVQVISLRETYTGEAVDITRDGALIVRDGGGALREVLAADVSVRGVMGYV